MIIWTILKAISQYGQQLNGLHYMIQGLFPVCSAHNYPLFRGCFLTVLLWYGYIFLYLLHLLSLLYLISFTFASKAPPVCIFVPIILLFRSYSTGSRVSLLQVLSSSSSDGGSSVRARETLDNTGNTTALSEKLKPELTEMRTLYVLYHVHFVLL